MDYPGFPCNGFDFHFEEVGPALGGLIVRDANGNPRPGILPTNLNLISAGSGWTLSVAPFVAVRAVGRAVLLGPSPDTVSLDIVPAPSANARIDTIYARVANVGTGEDLITVGVATGTAGASPIKPAAPAGAIELGTFRTTAGHSGTAQGTLAQTFQFSGTVGGTLIGRTTAQVTGFNAIQGSMGYSIQNSTLYVRAASGWVTVASTMKSALGLEDTGWTNFSVGSGWTTQEQTAVRRLNGVVYYKGLISSSTFTGDFTQIGTIPAGFRPTGPYRSADATLNSPVSVKVRVTSAGSLQVFRSEASGSWASLSQLIYPIG